MLIDDFGKTPVLLLPDGAVLITGDESVLVAADLHLGKAASFRAHGLPVPEGDTERDLKRLDDLVKRHCPGHLVIAGDLFHAESGLTKELVAELTSFTDRIGIRFTLVSGNHDRKIRGIPESLRQVDWLDISGIRIVHKPEDANADMPNVCGHIHPVLRIPDGRNTSLRLPCFHLHENHLTLPAFGSFTGGHIVRPAGGDRFFVTHREEVIEVPPELLGKR